MGKVTIGESNYWKITILKELLGKELFEKELLGKDY